MLLCYTYLEDVQVTASKKLLFYLFLIWTALTYRVSRKRDSGIIRVRLRFLKLEYLRTVGTGYPVLGKRV